MNTANLPGSSFASFGQMFHTIVDKMGQPPDIDIVSISCDRIPLTINFDINGL